MHIIRRNTNNERDVKQVADYRSANLLSWYHCHVLIRVSSPYTFFNARSRHIAGMPAPIPLDFSLPYNSNSNTRKFLNPHPKVQPA